MESQLAASLELRKLHPPKFDDTVGLRAVRHTVRRRALIERFPVDQPGTARWNQRDHRWSTPLPQLVLDDGGDRHR